ncbi:trans-Golgi network integral membrane protein 2-like [Embiotoca jacksoni]|uniref:trans-Golgi network integral membrane protein 2-like n=1 Tax=Embiotoca jacksoni TaxID=100190 RepID=UPI00370474FD
MIVSGSSSTPPTPQPPDDVATAALKTDPANDFGPALKDPRRVQNNQSPDRVQKSSACLPALPATTRRGATPLGGGRDGESSSSAEDSGPEAEAESESESSSSSSSCAAAETPERTSPVGGGDAEEEPGGGGRGGGGDADGAKSRGDGAKRTRRTRRAPLVKSSSLPASLKPRPAPLSLLPRPPHRRLHPPPAGDAAGARRGNLLPHPTTPVGETAKRNQTGNRRNRPPAASAAVLVAADGVTVATGVTSDIMAASSAAAAASPFPPTSGSKVTTPTSCVAPSDPAPVSARARAVLLLLPW